MTAFDSLPLVDHHVHPPFSDPQRLPFAAYFTEAQDEEVIRRHVPQTLFYQRALRELAGLLGCEPEAAAVQVARQSLGPDGLLRLIAQEARIELLLVDEGYPPEGSVSVEAMGAAAGCDARRIIRLETLAESLLARADSARELSRLQLEALERGPHCVGLKTVIAYRCGLILEEPAPEEAERCFQRVRAEAGARPRLSSRPLLNYLLLRALEWAQERGLPVQMHSGYGDHDIDLRTANPAHLRGILEQPRFRGLKLALLHASYPYSREASYLASVYPQVYVDWSEVNPMLSPQQLQRVLEELLALAPVTKLLYGSDAWGVPDWLWLGARAGRTALAAALAELPEREAIARRILRENALELYGLG